MSVVPSHVYLPFRGWYLFAIPVFSLVCMLKGRFDFAGHPFDMYVGLIFGVGLSTLALAFRAERKRIWNKGTVVEAEVKRKEPAQSFGVLKPNYALVTAIYVVGGKQIVKDGCVPKSFFDIVEMGSKFAIRVLESSPEGWVLNEVNPCDSMRNPQPKCATADDR